MNNVRRQDICEQRQGPGQFSLVKAWTKSSCVFTLRQYQFLLFNMIDSIQVTVYKCKGHTFH